jgi:hypothetical protein
MTVHLVAGDDWKLQFTLLNPDGTAFDLSGSPQILWTMLTGGHRVIQSAEVSIQVTNALQGQLNVLVPANVTTRLITAAYTHALRVIYAGVSATPFIGGYIFVSADPWGTAASQVTVLVGRSRTPRLLLERSAQVPLIEPERRLDHVEEAQGQAGP